MKERLDVLVAARGLADSREKAARLIMAGRVRSGDRVMSKPGHRVDPELELELARQADFVSRGGDKLEAAFQAFDPEVRGRVCLDVGASTGGFTDCLLQHGAARVFAVDVGKGQLHWRLRQDPRVTVMEQVNARYLEPADFEPRPTFAVVDVSFISLKLVLPAVLRVLAPDRVSELVTLIKPQFEAGPEKVARGGVVRDEAVREAVVAEVVAHGRGGLGMRSRGVVPSPLKGPAGNVEFLAMWEWGPQAGGNG